MMNWSFGNVIIIIKKLKHTLFYDKLNWAITHIADSIKEYKFFVFRYLTYHKLLLIILLVIVFLKPIIKPEKPRSNNMIKNTLKLFLFMNSLNKTIKIKNSNPLICQKISVSNFVLLLLLYGKLKMILNSFHSHQISNMFANASICYLMLTYINMMSL